MADFLAISSLNSHHDDHRITHVRSSPANECSNSRETECEPAFNSAHSSEWYNASADDSGVLHSTNTSWGFENRDFDFYDSSALAENPEVYHSNCWASRDFVLNTDDTLGFLAVPELIEDNPLNSTPEIGNLELVPSVSDDRHTVLDAGFGHNDNQSFSFDDYINYEFEFPTEVATMSHNPQPSLTSNESLPPTPLNLSSSSLFELLDARSSTEASPSTGSSISSKSLSPTSASKLVLSPSSSFECSMCRKTFAFKSRLESHMATHKKFMCTFEGCSRTFTELRGRTRHIKSVHESRKYKTCEVCGRDFTRKDKYDVHARGCSGAVKRQRSSN
ncbi:hypothetical protein V8E51_010722 [Hyaloscypha variabilis]